MEQDSELKRLEKFVENLLARFTELRTENAALLLDIQDRDEIIEELRESINSKDSERSEVTLRVGKIVNQIEEWEQSLEHNETEETSLEEETEVETASGEEGSPVEEDGGMEADEAGGEEGKGQQNLFSIETS